MKRSFVSSILISSVLVSVGCFSGNLHAELRSGEASLEARVKTLETVAEQVSRETELTWHLYQMAMNMAIEEAKANFQTLRLSQSVQQCANGVDRPNSCLGAWKDATRILDAAFARRNVAGTQNEFRMRLNQISEFADRSGEMRPIPAVDRDDGLLSYLMDNRRARRGHDLQLQISRSLSGLGNALAMYSAVSISTRAILEPMRMMAERPASEKVDVVWILLSGLEGAQSDLNRVKIDPSKEAKPSLYKLLPLRNIGQPG